MTEASLSPKYPEDNFILFRHRSFQAKNPFNIANIHSCEYMEKNLITPLNFSAYRDYLCPKKPPTSFYHINQKDIKIQLQLVFTPSP